MSGDPIVRVINSDVMDGLAELQDASVHCCVTSPPYWSLRDYGTASWEGGSAECDHAPDKRGGRFATPVSGKQATNAGSGTASRINCSCGARRVDKQIGLEPTLDCLGWATGARCGECWICHMVSVLAEVRRVLRDDGTLWLNVGDSYATGTTSDRKPTQTGKHGYWENPAVNMRIDGREIGLKPKDLCGQPWRLALALQADGWYLRSDIIWSKRAPMPESVTDRPTSAHEHIFLLAKSERYFYDAQGFREKSVAGHGSGNGYKREAQISSGGRGSDEPFVPCSTRNIRNVWHLSPEPFSEAHFATFPTEIPKRAILFGTSERGVCAECGAPWRRVVERSRSFESGSGRAGNLPVGKNGASMQGGGDTLDIRRGPCVTTQSLGWQPTCGCDFPDTVPATVLDPFSGAGTTGLVALRYGRRYIGIELNAEYVEMSIRRLAPTLAQTRLDLHS